MRPVAVVVEGQTEKAFVQNVLQPLAADRDLWLEPTVVPTSTASGVHRGGGSRWKHYRTLLVTLTNQPHWHRIALLLDYYGYPTDGPGHGAVGPPAERTAAMIAAIERDVPDPRLVAGVLVHEFETLVLAAITAEPSVLRGAPFDRQMSDMVARAIRAAGGDVELVDDSPATSPAHRIGAVWPQYRKELDGVRLVAAAPLDVVRALCPTFDGWLNRLLA